jgi:hypothetical protein
LEVVEVTLRGGDRGVAEQSGDGDDVAAMAQRAQRVRVP